MLKKRRIGRRLLLVVVLFTIRGLTILDAQGLSCPNLGFESGDFSHWVAFNWRYSIDAPYVNTPKAEGFADRRHTIISDTLAYDEKTGNRLRKVPQGFRFSARLGDAIIKGDKSPRCWNQSLQYTMLVDSLNALLILKFACVLEYADDHTKQMEPRFRLTLYDENGQVMPDCANYDVFASNSNTAGFQLYSPPGSEDPVVWRDWTTVATNLSKYIGKRITIEFMTADCTGHFHFGYAYFVAQCRPMDIAIKFCSGDTNAVLVAPEGFKTYSWIDGKGQVVGNNQILSVENPEEGSSYVCKLTSETNCIATLQATISQYNLVPEFSASMLDCAANRVQFSNHSTTNQGSLLYKWDFGNGATSTEKDPQFQFPSPGVYSIQLELTNATTSCKQSIIKNIEAFPKPKVEIVGDSIFCAGQSAVIKAYGANRYLWSNGSMNQSVNVGSPGGKYWVVGRSSSGCLSDTIYKVVTESANWNFALNGDTVLCNGDTVRLTAIGADRYAWNTGDTTNSIYVSETGTYRVTGTNSQGCRKTAKQIVTVHPRPHVKFYMSEQSLDSHRNTLLCYVDQENGVNYEWDWGDGSVEQGPRVRHTYQISKNLAYYTVTLKATNNQNCIDSTSQTIDVVVFVPNVFSPNGDGINDLFMPGEDIQIVDRNGIMLYKGNEGWDGTFNGREVDQDTYFYIVKYSDKNLKLQIQKGYLTLVR